MSRRHPVLATLVAPLAVVVVAALGACGDDPDPEPVVFTEPGTVLEAEVGDQVVIVLQSNPATGYSWELESTPLVDVVRLVDDVYVEPDSDLVGAPGRQEITFEALGAGTAELSLWYVRSFDDPKEPVDRAVFELVVADA